MEKGLISVIMSVYNTPEKYLRQAVESILNQTYSRFEFIIVDDGTTDQSLEAIASYRDSRIRVLRNETNLGITKSLNRALAAAAGEYIARMDSDDINEPERLERQAAFLDSRPECIVCGTFARLIGSKFGRETYAFSLPPKEAYRIRLLFGNYPSILHPSAMFRAEMLARNGLKYDERFELAQDYKMWLDCSRVAECANVPEQLFHYRVHNGSVSYKQKALRDECVRRILEEQVSALHLTLPGDWKSVHWGCLHRPERSPETKAWLERILAQNRIYLVYDQKLLEKTIGGGERI